MALFLSTFTNKIDAKGRVSVPSSFRAVLAGEDTQGVVLFKSYTHQALEGFPESFMMDMGARLDQFDVFSEAQDDLATTIFAESVQLPFDSGGRILLPADLMDFCGLTDQVAFVGMGRKFQMWNPQALEARKNEARKNVQAKGLSVPSLPAAKGDA